jgi:predicted DNA-binding transcriptional regulator
MPTTNTLTMRKFVANIASLLRYYGLVTLLPTFEVRPDRMARVFRISERHCRRLISAAVDQGLLTRAETRDEKGRLGYEYRISNTVTPSDFEPDRYEGEFGGKSDAEYWHEDHINREQARVAAEAAGDAVDLQARINAHR